MGKHYTHTNHATRTRGGVGWYADPRDNNRFEEMGLSFRQDTEPLPGELRKWTKDAGDGQRMDFFEVTTDCARCGEQDVPTNVLSLCGDCALALAEGAPEVPTKRPKKAHPIRSSDILARLLLALS